jgi:hypothetical protein
MMFAKFLMVGKPNQNGRVYPQEVVENALFAYKQLSEQDVFPIYNRPAIAHTEEDIIGLAFNVRIEDGFLCGDVQFVEGKMDHIPPNEIINVHPNAVGSVKDGVIQEDYRLNGFCLVRKPQ